MMLYGEGFIIEVFDFVLWIVVCSGVLCCCEVYVDVCVFVVVFVLYIVKDVCLYVLGCGKGCVYFGVFVFMLVVMLVGFDLVCNGLMCDEFVLCGFNGIDIIEDFFIFMGGY